MREERWKREARRAALRAARKDIGRRKRPSLDERRQWTASCRLDYEEMLRLIELCEERGTTRYALIKTMIREYMKAQE